LSKKCVKALSGPVLENTTEDFHRKLLDSLYDGVYFVDRNRRISYWNAGAGRVSGFSPDHMIGQYCHNNRLMHTDGEGRSLCIDHCPLMECIETGVPVEKEVFLRHRDGHRVPVHVRSTPVHNESGEIIGAVEVFSDNSSKLAAVERASELERMAYVDPLTSLGNRRYAERNLMTRMSEFERFGWPFGVMLFDVDRFKIVNDSHGHHVGDAYLLMIGRTLAQSVRPFDLLARWGGDEFIGVFENVNLDQMARLAERCRALVAQSQLPLEGGGESALQASVSVGGSVVKTGDSVELLLQRADANLYEVKRTGRGHVVVR
jgi:diguanylate cyclase (GGDEF)-like protein/PAS domain S-box-containing protein